MGQLSEQYTYPDKITQAIFIVVVITALLFAFYRNDPAERKQSNPDILKCESMAIDLFEKTNTICTTSNLDFDSRVSCTDGAKASVKMRIKTCNGISNQ